MLKYVFNITYCNSKTNLVPGEKVLKPIRNCQENSDSACTIISSRLLCVCRLFLYVLSFKHTNRQVRCQTESMRGTEYDKLFYP